MPICSESIANSKILKMGFLLLIGGVPLGVPLLFYMLSKLMIHNSFLGQTAAKIGQTDSCVKGSLAMCVPCLNLYCLCKQRGMIREKEGVEVPLTA